MEDVIKCLCGHGTDVKQKELFVELGEVTGMDFRDKPSGTTKTFKMVACPKCGTIKILI